MKATDSWNPTQYRKFQQERDAPFYDLMKLVHPKPNMTIVDLGCGTGHQTASLHTNLKAKETLGIDASPEMLQEASALCHTGLTFEQQDIEAFKPPRKFDLIFSNAALQWLPNHPQLFSNLISYLAEEGQIALQVPSNFDYPTHTIAKMLGDEEPFKQHMKGACYPSVLSLTQYAELFHQLGFKKQHVHAHVYAHELESSDALVEWVKGTLLTMYRKRLTPDVYQLFLETYTKRIHAHFGSGSIFFPFTRILMWAER